MKIWPKFPDNSWRLYDIITDDQTWVGMHQFQSESIPIPGIIGIGIGIGIGRN